MTNPAYQPSVVAEVSVIARRVNARLRVRNRAATASRNNASPKCKPLVMASPALSQQQPLRNAIGQPQASVDTARKTEQEHAGNDTEPVGAFHGEDRQIGAHHFDMLADRRHRRGGELHRAGAERQHREQARTQIREQGDG